MGALVFPGRYYCHVLGCSELRLAACIFATRATLGACFFPPGRCPEGAFSWAPCRASTRSVTSNYAVGLSVMGTGIGRL